ERGAERGEDDQRNAPPAPREQPRVLDPEKGDGETDERLDRAHVGLHDAKDRQRERHAVRDGEARHERDHLAHPLGQQEERDDEDDVVPSREEVLDAEPEIVDERATLAPSAERPGVLREIEDLVQGLTGTAVPAYDMPVSAAEQRRKL